MSMPWKDVASNPPDDNRDIIAYAPQTSGLFYIGHYDLGDYIILFESIIRK